MDFKIKLAANTIPNNHLDELSEWIKTYPRLTKDKETLNFENIFSNYLDIKYSNFVNSGSSANLLIAAANLYYKSIKNKKVAVPAVSWTTTLSPFLQLGYEPFLIDCDPNNLGINIDHLYEAIKKHEISSLMLVHVLGHDSSIEKIVDICDQYKIRLFEDSCEALGSICSNKRLGSFSLASSFSFYYGHHISTIEGGSVCSNDDEFNQIVKSLRSHGWSRDLDQEFANNLQSKYQISDFRNLYSFYYPGFNFRSTEINAFLGCRQIQLLDDYSLKRNKLFNRYKNNLSKFWNQTSSSSFISSFAYGTLVDNPDEVWQYLKINGIESRPLICGSMGLQPYWKTYNGQYSSLKYADQVHQKGIYLPINADLTFEDVDLVCEYFCKKAKIYNFQ